MWQRFTERARRTVFFAQEEAGRLGENYVSTEHILLGVVRDDGSVAARILDRMGVSLARIRSEIERQVTRGDGRLGTDMQLTPRAKRVIDLAYDEARQLSNNYIGTEHLLLGLVREGEGLAGRVLAKLGVELERVRLEVMSIQDNDTGMQAKPERQQRTPAPAAAPSADMPQETRFALAFTTLDANVQQRLQAEGVPFRELSADMKIVLQAIFVGTNSRQPYLLTPDGLVRVGVMRVGGATHYTVAVQAASVTNFLVEDAPPAPQQAPPAAEPEADPTAGASPAAENAADADTPTAESQTSETTPDTSPDAEATPDASTPPQSPTEEEQP